MKFKLDENFGQRTEKVFRKVGHDIQTVSKGGLAGASVSGLYTTCQVERRCLVTLDLDFADVIRFPPKSTGGMIVIRLLRNPSLSAPELLIGQCLQALEHNQIVGKLWTVEPNRIRIHQTDPEE